MLFGKKAINSRDQLSKGSQITIDGHLIQKRWTNANGQKRSRFEIDVEKIQFGVFNRNKSPRVNVENNLTNKDSHAIDEAMSDKDDG